MQWNKYCLVIIVLSLWATCGWATSLEVENYSFEGPQVDPNAFQALPYIDSWQEADNDSEMSSAPSGPFTFSTPSAILPRL